MYINIIHQPLKKILQESIHQPLLENIWLDHSANHSFCSGIIIVGFQIGLVVYGNGWSLVG
jgi:hypothetical protein